MQRKIHKNKLNIFFQRRNTPTVLIKNRCKTLYIFKSNVSHFYARLRCRVVYGVCSFHEPKLCITGKRESLFFGKVDVTLTLLKKNSRQHLSTKRNLCLKNGQRNIDYSIAPTNSIDLIFKSLFKMAVFLLVSGCLLISLYLIYFV